MKNLCLALLVFCLLPCRALSQAAERVSTSNYNGWYMYFGDHKVAEKWGVHLEGQWRRHDVIAKPQQLLLRPGVNYDVNERLMVTVGYAFVDTLPYGRYPVAVSFPEHRLFQQALFRSTSRKVLTSHRYRLEQRFLGETQRDLDGDRRVEDWRYENRFRYMFRANIPFSGETIEKGTWYLGVYDEIFVNFGKNVAANVFDQNRAYAALGYSLGKIGNLEVGYLNQAVLQRSGRVVEFNHTFQLALFSTFSFDR